MFSRHMQYGAIALYCPRGRPPRGQNAQTERNRFQSQYPSPQELCIASYDDGVCPWLESVSQ